MTLAPGANAADVLNLDMEDIALRRGANGKFRFGSDIDVRESIQQFNCAAFGYSGTSPDHQVVIKYSRFPAGLQRDDHTPVSLDILQLLFGSDMAADNLIAIQTNPVERDLRTAILVDRHKMG